MKTRIETCSISTVSFTSKCHSFKEMDNLSLAYSLSLTPKQRLDIAQYLREQFYKIKGIKPQRLNKKVCVLGSYKKHEKRKRF